MIRSKRIFFLKIKLEKCVCRTKKNTWQTFSKGSKIILSWKICYECLSYKLLKINLQNKEASKVLQKGKRTNYSVNYLSLWKNNYIRQSQML